jgi:hypothetical protein
MNDPREATFLQKIALVLFGAFLCLALLEIGKR